MAAVADRDHLTDEQRRALETRDVSVALSAGAGCGKTFVLTERFLSHLAAAEARELSQFVAITFTERAAREMRDRIRHRCRERLDEARDEDSRRHWLAMLRELEAARVSTIHAFCAALLRSHAVEAGLDPRFDVLEQAGAATLLVERIDDALRRQLAERHSATMDLVVRFGLERLRRMIELLLGRRDQCDLDRWRREDPETLLDVWQEFHAAEVRPRLLARLSSGPTATRVLDALSVSVPEHPVMQTRRRQLLELLPHLPLSADPAATLDQIHDAARVQGGGSKHDWDSEEAYVAVREALIPLRAEIAGARGVVDFDRAAARPAAVAALQLVEVAVPIAEDYRRAKQEAACLDFDDLLLGARDLLCAPGREELRRRVAGQIERLLVDESQDTDPLQVELIESLCGDELTTGKLFVVGDYKQSIYRFRRADPRVFTRLRARIPEAGRLPLTLNFRSQPAILHFVNALFRDDLGDEYEALRAHREQIAPTPAVEFLWAEAEEPDEKTDDLRRREARWIARRLRSLMDSGEELVWDQEAARDGSPRTRAVVPGDIALLFRALSDVQAYEEALRDHGIPYYLVGGRAFYAQQEIFDLLNLLRSLASAGDAVSLAGALRSGFFSLDDETLFWLAQHPGGLCAGAFAELPADLSAEQRVRAARAAAKLTDLRRRKDQLPIAALIQDALDSTGYDCVLLGEFLGERKLANLHKLIDQARDFDRSGIFTLADYLTQLAEFVAVQPDEPLATTLPETTSVVRLMTIHQSKGLEFPIVVVPDLERRHPATPAPLAYDSRLGPLVRLPKDDDDAPTCTGFDLHRVLEDEEDEAERLRLLYVATTRAADHLILSAGMKSLDSVDSTWMQLLGRRFDLANGACRAAIADPRQRPEVRVTRKEPALPPRTARNAGRRLRSETLDAARQAAGLRDDPPASILPIAADRSARRQYSFSRLHGTLTQAASVPPAEDDALPAARIDYDPLELGTLVHDVLSLVPFGGTCDVARIVRERAARRPGTSSRDVEETIDLVARFLKSPRAASLAAARHVRRELEFLLAWPPAGVPADGPLPRQAAWKRTLRQQSPPSRAQRQLAFLAEETGAEGAAWAASEDARAGGLFLQGFIDCLYQDEAGWHILDYKTNRLGAGGAAAAAAAYEMQMLVYALAVERALHVAPRTLTLHFLRTGAEHAFAFDSAARGRVAELVEAGLAAARGP